MKNFIKNLFLDDTLNMLSVFFIVLLIFTVIIFGVFAVIKIDKISCVKKANIMNIESNYSVLTGCMVRIDNQWQPFNEYNTINFKNNH